MNQKCRGLALMITRMQNRFSECVFVCPKAPWVAGNSGRKQVRASPLYAAHQVMASRGLSPGAACSSQ